MKQLVCVSELYASSPQRTSLVRVVALRCDLFPWTRCPHAWTGLTQIGMHTSQRREICIPLQEVQTSRRAKQSMRAHTPTVQCSDLELQTRGQYFLKKSSCSKQNIWVNARKLQILQFGSNVLSLPCLDARYSQQKVDFHPEDFSFVEVVFSIRKSFRWKVTNWF